MIGIILNAVLGEAKAFFNKEGSAGQVMLRTDFKPKSTPDYSMPLVLLTLEDGEDSFQYPGGLTQMGWRFGFNSYNYEPDAYVDDPSSYSTGLLYDPIDTIRRHFSSAGLFNGVVEPGTDLIAGIVYQVQNGTVTYNGQTFPPMTFFTAATNILSFTATAGAYVTGTSWLTPGMVNIFNRYGFQFTLSGVTAAESLEHENGLAMGYRINFTSTALDDGTDYTEEVTELETIIQSDAGDVVATSTSILNQPFAVMSNVSTNQAQVIPPNTFVVSIGVIPVDGQPMAPSLLIGYETGGNEIVELDKLVGFQLIRVEQYFENGTVFWLTPSNGSFNVNITAILNYL